MMSSPEWSALIWCELALYPILGGAFITGLDFLMLKFRGVWPFGLTMLIMKWFLASLLLTNSFCKALSLISRGLGLRVFLIALLVDIFGVMKPPPMFSGCFLISSTLLLGTQLDFFLLVNKPSLRSPFASSYKVGQNRWVCLHCCYSHIFRNL